MTPDEALVNGGASLSDAADETPAPAHDRWAWLREARRQAGQIDRLSWILAAAAIILDAAVWTYVALRQGSLPDVLPIHYSSSGQVDRIGLRQQLFILPAIGLLTLLANAALSVFLRRRDQQLGHMLLSISIVVQLLLVGASLQLVH
jgi:uncharacterized membrane protein